jgi:YHS domain-containing protein
MLGRARDPVCKATIRKAKAFKYTYLGKIFYFDSEACLQTFKEDPEKFGAGKNKKRFLEKLAENNQSEEPPKCGSCGGCGR